jgi:colanic acid/amylovoran biosynthesis glycosyltransferase
MTERLAPPAKLFVCGTPFCGLSVVGQALADASVFMGGPLGTPTTNDAVGLFVNRGVVALHNEILVSAGADWLAPATSPLRLQDAHRQRAREVLAAHVGERAGWAIVDPRLTHMTALWRDLVPDARWVFVVRPPAETAWALLRRRSMADQDPSPIRRLSRALDLWNWYGGQIVEFCRQERERTALLFAPDDFGPLGDAQLAILTAGRVSTELGKTYHPQLLRTSSPKLMRLGARLHEQVAQTMHDLREIRDGQLRARDIGRQPASAHVAVATARTRIVCLASRRRLAISETFIRDHLRHLPASIRWLVGGAGEVKRDKDDLPLASVLERAIAAGLTEFGYLGKRIETRGIARYLRREGVNVVLAEYGPIAVEYIDACQATGIPLVAHFHGYDAYKRTTLAEFGAAYRRLFTAAQVLVVVSRDMARQLESLGAPADRIVWSPCGVDTRAFAGAVPEQSDPVFVSVGRFVEKKAPHNVLRAFHHLAHTRPDARLVMVGEGVMLEPSRILCDALGLSDRVFFTGALAPAEVASYLRSARAFIQHSLRDAEGNAEGTPVSVLEAGASGLAVVATRHMGIADVVKHGDTGFLVDEGDVRAMGEHLITLCDDPVLAGAMGRRARDRICAEFSIEHSIARLSGALDKAIEGGRGR